MVSGVQFMVSRFHCFGPKVRQNIMPEGMEEESCSAQDCREAERASEEPGIKHNPPGHALI